MKLRVDGHDLALHIDDGLDEVSKPGFGHG